MDNMIRITGVKEERLGDAPFVGALISSISCHKKCKGCFNQHLQTQMVQEYPVSYILHEVQANPLHQGIILGGLEWTEQPDEMTILITEALSRGLQVMLYTHLTQEEFEKQFPDLSKLPIWCKFGEYREGQDSVKDPTGVVLASNNQRIVYMGGR